MQWDFLGRADKLGYDLFLLIHGINNYCVCVYVKALGPKPNIPAGIPDDETVERSNKKGALYMVKTRNPVLLPVCHMCMFCGGAVYCQSTMVHFSCLCIMWMNKDVLYWVVDL